LPIDPVLLGPGQDGTFLKKLNASWQGYHYEFDVPIVQPALSCAAVTEEG
jgi:hypothetical protein